jgi:hypothetical protein
MGEWGYLGVFRKILKFADTPKQTLVSTNLASTENQRVRGFSSMGLGPFGSQKGPTF